MLDDEGTTEDELGTGTGVVLGVFARGWPTVKFGTAEKVETTLRTVVLMVAALAPARAVL